jgi:Ca2+-binding EF-hand superfamily protein
MMKSMDADGNGEISKEEFVQAHEEMFDSMDENGDGMLDREEQATMMQKMKHHEMEDMEHHERKEKPDTTGHH